MWQHAFEPIGERERRSRADPTWSINRRRPVTADIRQRSPMTINWIHCYRISPSLRNVGLLLMLLAGGMTVVSLIAWWTQPPNDPANMPFVITSFCLFTLLGAYFLLWYTRYRLYVGESLLRQVGAFRDNQVDLNAVTELKWRLVPRGGSVLLTERTTRLSIALGSFEPADRQCLIEYLRRSIDESRQIGWQRFDKHFSTTPEKEKQVARAYVLVLAVFGAYTVAFGVMWALGFGLQYLFLGGVNAMMAAYMLRLRRRKKSEHGSTGGEHTDERDPC